MLTLTQAKHLTRGTWLYSTNPSHYKHGIPARVRVTSVKTWKTRPDVVEVRIVHGLYDHGAFNQQQLDSWTTDEAEAIAARPPLPALVDIQIMAALAQAHALHSYDDATMDAARIAAEEAAHAGKSWRVAAIRVLKAARTAQQAA